VVDILRGDPDAGVVVLLGGRGAGDPDAGVVVLLGGGAGDPDAGVVDILGGRGAGGPDAGVVVLLGGGAGDPDAGVVVLLGGEGAAVAVVDLKKLPNNPEEEEEEEEEEVAGPPKISISLSASLLSCVARALTRLSGFPLIPDTRFLATWAVGSNSSPIKCVKPFLANV